MTEKRIFITGGASGLGRALAERYARAGYRVCIADVNAERGASTLAALGGGAHFLRCDVTREHELVDAARWLEQHWGGVDIVVNNAGVAIAGAIEDTPLRDWQWVIDINLLGVVRGCKVFTPLFKRQRHGHFVNVASLFGLVFPPQMSAYNATKAAVVALSETIKLELGEHGIGVSVVCPPFFRTNLAESLRATDPHLEGVTRRLVERAPVSAEHVAERVFRGVARRDFHILPHPEAKAAWMFKRLAPHRLFLAVMRVTSAKMLGRPRATRRELTASAVA